MAVAGVAGASDRWALEVSEWRLRARCRTEAAESFYPPDREKCGARLEREWLAKQICLSCPVMEQCRSHAIETAEPHGVWGATTPRERERLQNGLTSAAGA